MVTDSLEILIRRYVPLGKLSSKGFYIVKGACCRDYKERGGFKFDGESVVYSCFNCSTKVIYDPTQGSRHSLSKKMTDVLVAFGIPEDELKKCISMNFFKPKIEKVDINKPSELGLPSLEVPLPVGSVLITDDTSPWCEVGRAYLESRCIDFSSMPFYVTDEKSMMGRVIIPYLFRGKIIYWQGRALDSSIKPRYKNPQVERDNIFFNMDELYRHTDDPLFVTEGPLDSLSIGKNAISTLGSSLSKFQLKELKRISTRRRVIFVIDKNANGHKLGKTVLSEGENLPWFVTCFPPNFDDANDALIKLGHLWVITHLTTTASDGFKGKLLLQLNCRKT